MNIETVITITHFSVSVKQLIGFLRACIWLPATLLLGSWHLFPALAAQTSSLQTTAEQVLAHSRLKTAAINQQVHLPQRKRAHTGSFSQIVSILGEVKLVNVCIGALASGGQVLHRSRHPILPK